MADALASGASARKGVEVRLLSWAPGTYLTKLALNKVRAKGFLRAYI